MFSCPMAELMPQTMASRKWTVKELISNFQCVSCYQDKLNTWAPCIRLSSMVNTHPNLCSRTRQIWFIIFNFLKYLNCEPQFGDEDFKFKGEHSVEYHQYNRHLPDRRRLLPMVPRYLQISSIIRRGKYFYWGQLPWHSQ